MTHFNVFYGLAMILTIFALFVLWVLTGPVGVVLAALMTHALLRVCERQRDAEHARRRPAHGFRP